LQEPPADEEEPPIAEEPGDPIPVQGGRLMEGSYVFNLVFFKD
jgi:hypothetical protein